MRFLYLGSDLEVSGNGGRTVAIPAMHNHRHTAGHRNGATEKRSHAAGLNEVTERDAAKESAEHAVVVKVRCDRSRPRSSCFLKQPLVVEDASAIAAPVKVILRIENGAREIIERHPVARLHRPCASGSPDAAVHDC